MTPESWALVGSLVLWALHARRLKAKAKRDMLDLISLQLKCTGRTPCI